MVFQLKILRYLLLFPSLTFTHVKQKATITQLLQEITMFKGKWYADFTS